MPRSAVAMSEHDGEYTFDIEGYLIGAYNGLTKPIRRAICAKVRKELDRGVIEEMIDELIAAHALDLQGWSLKADDEE